MRSSELKSRLSALICFCVIFSLFVGCVAQTPVRVPTVKSEGSKESFAPEPYIMKTPTPGDYDTLRRYLRSTDKSIANSAGIILGHYYIMAEDYWNAELLFKRYYSETILPPYMQKLGELWQLDFALDRREFTTAARWAAKIKTGLNNKERVRALETYCLINKLQAVDGDPYSCVTQRIENAEADVKKADTFKGGGEYIFRRVGGALNILVVSSKNMQDASSGVYFYGKRNPDLDHKLRLSRTPIEGDWDFVIDIDNGYLGGRGYGIFFSANLAEYLSKFDEYIDLPCRRLLIGTERNLRTAANEFAKTLTGKNMEVVVLDVRDNYQIRDTLVKWEDAPFCALGAGTEAEMTVFIPKVRQYVVRSDQRVYILEDTFSGSQLGENYRNYFYSSRFFPVFDLYFSDEVSIFAYEYREFSGQELTYPALLGYEMMHFIHTQITGEETGESYFTGILGINDNRVFRQLNGYSVSGRGAVDTINVRLPSIEESGIGGEE